MNESDFRFKYCELMEFYQYIEMRLKIICSEFLADEEKDWYERLDEYETDSLGELIKKCSKLQQEKKITLFIKDDFAKLDDIRKKRNYWAHQCFGGNNPIIFKHDMVKNNEYAKKINSDLDEAEDWDCKLTEMENKLRKIKVVQ
ncbi:MAG: hypothetical protein K6E78_01140 [Treponema sp.]|nr:hypothetical protein [Treponema sp.]